jgi:hypothetical protein
MIPYISREAIYRVSINAIFRKDAINRAFTSVLFRIEAIYRISTNAVSCVLTITDLSAAQTGAIPHITLFFLILYLKLRIIY